MNEFCNIVLHITSQGKHPQYIVSLWCFFGVWSHWQHNNHNHNDTHGNIITLVLSVFSHNQYEEQYFFNKCSCNTSLITDCFSLSFSLSVTARTYRTPVTLFCVFIFSLSLSFNTVSKGATLVTGIYFFSLESCQ